MSNADSSYHEQFDLFSDELNANSVAEVTPGEVAAKEPLANAVSPAEHAPGGNYLSVKQVAAHFGVSSATIWRWCTKGDFPKPVRFSNRVTRWARVDMEQFEARRRTLVQE
ncbi:AlpA family transcriptional regulator [Oceanicola sp. 502str15]|uniref:helix-turn-helix transcriptional regulator n=1 Tax=Oceanicola sp. 502str15 TaxID=2696061 RepID=UPI0020943B3F|nr:helix-turn-helix domain-containing protein [Oceanicola sp. 502str15]MCO6383361.1 AlpA family phage regulatory protein [Oceanicola sp. 502str15]